VVVAQCIVLVVVREDRPYPNAGFPVRFEWLHPWTLFGIVLLTCSALTRTDLGRSTAGIRRRIYPDRWRASGGNG
jgi:hypothetical protein